MEQPLISVIVPVYKVEAYLDKCISSITEQTYRNLEILLVDDGSPDRSGEICDAWAAKDSRIRVIHQKNAGGGAARNTGMDAATGQFVGFVDSDDYLHPRMYEHLYSLMAEGVDIAECQILETEGENAPLEDGTAGEQLIYPVEEAMLLHIRDERFRQTPPNKLYRAMTMKGIRYPIGTLIDDEFFTYRLIANCKKLAWSSSHMYAYRQRHGSAMHKPYSLGRLDGILAKQQRLAFLKEKIPALEWEAKQDLYLTCLYAMQGCLGSMKGGDLEKARKLLAQARADVQPLPLAKIASPKKKILFLASRLSFEGVARLLNFLIRIHVLS